MNKTIVINFIDKIWNKTDISEIRDYLTDDYIDHSLPIALPKNWEGTAKWIETTSGSFQHQTVIEDILCEDDKVFMRISMKLKHTGLWRSHLPSEKEITTRGYRLFRIDSGRIAEHWATIDGSEIEVAIIGTGHGCKI
ncbi:SnoaL-like polyketide cyclase [compost metagenome]|uniref:ester cyclase n=1 Tax=Sphingobacterium sp. 18053 TaxID=2681401 RepID=UPI000FB53E5E|nr:ester cyclase [Sphingobacterium sp. 18053]